jgi:hypothetical protein
VHFLELQPQNQQSEAANGSQHYCENGHPDGSGGSAPSRPISGFLVLFLGAALMKFAFYIADEPSPPMVTRFLYLGCGLCAVGCVAQGVVLLFR